MPLRHSATTRRRIVHVGLADLRDVQVDLAMLTLTSRTVRIAEILDALAVFKPCNPS